MDTIFSNLEKNTIEYWKAGKIFEKSLKKRAKARDFVFYEGPPTANGKPGIHHVLARSFKDIICRYKTMQGFRVLRKAGWDTHGLPVELEVEKKLGLKNKKDIEKYGIAAFNQNCRESVWQYKDEWEKLTERLGYWLDMEHPYVTYENDYIESVWWAIKQIDQKGLLYKDYKVVPYCPRCGTPLSSHEVAQGYKKVKENSIYVKFAVEGQENTYLLVWTTTPWTLPGNVAVAVNPKITYIKARIGAEKFILSKERTMVLGGDHEIVEEFNGDKLIGMKYKPPFNFTKPDKPVWVVVPADFVSVEDGTGLVHIAPAFGEDDMAVAKKNNLPVIMNVNEEGKFKSDVGDWQGMWVKEADPLIIAELKKRNVLFKEELYEHDYPFCWRCSSALLYYAKESWFINMQKVKTALIKNNKTINWVPAHLKDGRFGEWLREVKDWAFSRERYWGTPLPVWQCQKCEYREVIGSKKDLINQKFSDNRYYLLRHGESMRQINKLVSCWPEKVPCPLTETGLKQVAKSAKELKKKKIDLIFASDLLRTKQTAGILSKEVGVDVIYDARLREFNAGIFNNDSPQKVWDYVKDKGDIFNTRVPEGENWNDIKKRMNDFMAEINAKYSGKNIAIVSHECPLTLLENNSSGLSNEEILKWRPKNSLRVSKWREIIFKQLPYNQQMEMDFHRPYIDEVKFKCPQCGDIMRRVPDLIDVWFDSGSMPFAQNHYPFEGQKLIFPADYISEAIDQTRGWFYTLLAIATLLGLKAPYKNVVSLGHVLDEKGEKMSKSKGNVVSPWDVFEKYGADAARWYFYTVNQPGEVKMFSEKELQESLRKFLMIYWNSFVFFETYSKDDLRTGKFKTKNVLDRWILSKLNNLILEVTDDLDQYDITAAARAIENFTVKDLSLWYIRRSRKRFKEAEATLSFVLSNLARLTAPFVPFLSEEIYGRLTENKTRSSVHLADWPKPEKRLIDRALEQAMEKTREIVALALAERAKSGIKVRQPLQALQISEKLDQELLDLIKDEINVKEIIYGSELKLNTIITQELKEEGMVRDAIRQIQEMRKKAGLKPEDRILIEYSGSPELNEILMKNRSFILKETKAKDFNLIPKVEQKDLWLEIKKI